MLLSGRTSGESLVLRPPRPVRDAMVPLKLHTTDAYILLVPPPPKLADGAAAAAAPPAHERAGASAQEGVARLLLATGELHSGQGRRPWSASDGP